MRKNETATLFAKRRIRDISSLIRFFRRTQGVETEEDILKVLLELGNVTTTTQIEKGRAKRILEEIGRREGKDEIAKRLCEVLPPTPQVFIRYLHNLEHNHVFDPMHRKVYMDMTRPLSHYFVASSHNTYLTGNQINSKSSASAIIRALREGIRLIELDCWDSPSGVPMVKHGSALPTAPIKLSSALTAVKVNAFVASPYPVILTIENHCNQKLQIIQAKMLREILGESLYILKDTNENGFNVFPSPKDLLGRILVRHKIKGIKDSNALRFQDKIVVIRSKSLSSTKSSSSFSSSTSLSSSSSLLLSTKTKSISPTTLLNVSSTSKRKSRGELPLPSSSELLRLVTIPNVKVKQKTLRSAIESEVALSCSWNENKCKKLNKACPELVLQFTQRHIARVYPAFYRVDSSNFDPQSVWNFGMQCVALNTQTSDRIMGIARAKFNDNGACGYVLKPNWMFQTSHIQRVGKYLPFRVYTRTLRLHIERLILHLKKKRPSSMLFMKSSSEVFLSIDMIGKKFGKYRKTISFVRDDDEEEANVWIPRGHVMMISESSDDKSSNVGSSSSSRSSNKTMVFPLASQGCGMEILSFRLFVGSRCVAEYSIAVQNLRLGVRVVPLCSIVDGSSSMSSSSSMLCRFDVKDLPHATVKWPATKESELKAKEILRLSDFATLGMYRHVSGSDLLTPELSPVEADNIKIRAQTEDKIPVLKL